MRATRGSLGAALALSIGVAACGGAAPQAKTPEAAGATAAEKPKTGAIELVKGAPKLPGEGMNRDELAEGMNVAPAQQDVMFGLGAMSSGRREAVKTEPFRLADLPRVEIPEPLPPSQAPVASAEGEPAKDLFVDWESALRSSSMIGRQEAYTSVRVSLRGHHLARIRVGNNEGTVTAGAAGGVYVVCRVAEDSVRRFVTARWESLAAAGGGEAALSIVDAWFDMHTCKATIVRRTRVPLKALASGIFYGYREACSGCAPGERERVTFLSPNPQHIASAGVGGEATTTLGTLTRVVLPVRKGGGGSVVVRYSSGVLRDWLSALGRSESPEADVVAGIDIAQSVEDAEPIAVAYASGAASPLGPVGRPPSARPMLRHPAPASSPPPPPKGTVKIPKPQSLPKSELADPFLLRSRK